MTIGPRELDRCGSSMCAANCSEGRRDRNIKFDRELYAEDKEHAHLIAQARSLLLAGYESWVFKQDCSIARKKILITPRPTETDHVLDVLNALQRCQRHLVRSHHGL